MYLLPGSLLTALIWGLTPFYSKHLMTYNISNEVVLFITSILFFLIMLIYVLCTYKYKQLWSECICFHNQINYVYFTIWIILTYILSISIYYKLLERHDTFLVVALTSIYPLVTAIAAYYLFKEKLSMLNMLGIVLIVGGIILLNIK